MRLSTFPRGRRRAGFSLIELLVVVAILGILMSLTAAAVMKALPRGYVVSNQVEIAQLDAALKKLMSTRGLGTPPSQLLLCEKLSDYGKPPAPGLAAESLAYLAVLFPGITDPAGPWATSSIDWNQNGSVDGPTTLTGDQSLVFFLGGLPMRSGTALGCKGFARNPQNPADTTPGLHWEPPAFNFDSSRLIQGSNGYLSYGDAYRKGTPYAYFSSYGSSNGYNRFGSLECQALPGSPTPYADLQDSTGIRYLNPDTFQILSAGADGIFGGGSGIPGGSPPAVTNLWTPSTASAMAGVHGQDDQSNFSTTILSSRQ